MKKSNKRYMVLLCCVLIVAVYTGKVFWSDKKIQKVKINPEVASYLDMNTQKRFQTFFEELQIWYNSYECEEDGVTLMGERDLDRINKVMLQIPIFPDENNKNVPGYVKNYDDELVWFAAVDLTGINLQLNMNEKVSFDEKSWGNLGNKIDTLVKYYQEME